MNRQVKARVSVEQFQYNPRLDWYEAQIAGVEYSISCAEGENEALNSGVELLNNLFNYHPLEKLISFFKNEMGLSWYEEELDQELTVDQYLELIELESITINRNGFGIYFTDGYSEQFDGLFYGHALIIEGTKDELISISI